MSLVVDLSWSNFKGIISAPNMLYADLSGNYYISGSTANANYTCKIIKNGGSDQTDFEANYKSSATSLT